MYCSGAIKHDLEKPVRLSISAWKLNSAGIFEGLGLYWCDPTSYSSPGKNRLRFPESPSHARSRTALFVSVCAEIEFKEGDKEHVVEVDVLYDGVREMREAFTLHLKPDENMVAETQVRDFSVRSHTSFHLARLYPAEIRGFFRGAPVQTAGLLSCSGSDGIVLW